MDPQDTVLPNASLAKAFTAVGVLQPNERGLIDLHEDVRPYFTEFPLETSFDKPMTFANLLTNTEGFDSRMIGMAARTEADLLPLGELIEAYGATQIYPPGTHMTYNDYASNLSGYLTQEISGLPFSQYMAENSLLPPYADRINCAGSAPDPDYAGFHHTDLATGRPDPQSTRAV